MMHKNSSRWCGGGSWVIPAAVLAILLLPLDSWSQTGRTLRWELSPSPETVGYRVYVGNTSNFSPASARDSIDIADTFSVVNGVGEFPVDLLLDSDGFLRMTAYDSAGRESVPSNELFVEFVVPACTIDTDCPGSTACRVSRCDSILGCTIENRPNGTICNDGNASTTNDMCSQGQCIGTTPAPEPLPGGVLLREDFQSYAAGSDPSGWFDTGAKNSLAEAPSLFRALAAGADNIAFGTPAGGHNIHSHVVAPDGASWKNYEVLGRLRSSDPSSGIGVTAYSDYPKSDTYFRLRSNAGGEFELAHHPHASQSCTGTLLTGVTPVSNTWYRFLFKVDSLDSGSRIRAKVWRDGTSEPQSWQADCTSSTGPRSGRVGVWADGPGGQLWDDLEVRTASAPPLPMPECTTDAQCSDGNLCNGVETCSQGVCTSGSALACTSSSTCSDAMCDPTLGCIEIPVNGRSCDDGNACTQGDVCNQGSCTGGSPLACDPSGTCLDATCDPSLGCVEAPADGRLCDDGDACTVSDVCQGGVCGGAAASCPTPTQCQVGLCDSVLGCVVNDLPDGTLCDDGDPNTIDDLCGAGMCLGERILPDPEPEPGEESIIGPVLMFDDFELYQDGSAALGWLDATAELATLPGLFQTTVHDQQNGVLTAATTEEVTSHFVENGSAGWEQYRYTGRMRVGSDTAAIGVTLYSKVPEQNRYLQLVKPAGVRPFSLVAVGGGICAGQSDTGFPAEAHNWYRFNIRTQTVTGGLRVLARVWNDGELEPAQWQIDCTLAESGTTFSGRAGVWAAGPGAKFWDDLLALQVPNDPTLLYADDFESYAPGDDPVGWFDTGDRNSLSEAPSLFSALASEAGNIALGTLSNGHNIHSHLVVPNGQDWRDYEVEGQMRLTDPAGGIGVTLYSDYPQSDTYFRLRHFASGGFELAHHPHGQVACAGGSVIDFAFDTDRWYRFRLRAENDAIGTRLRARVWDRDTAEPADWQADCQVVGAKLTGRVGVWADGAGIKYWDELKVRSLTELAPPNAPPTEEEPPTDDPAIPSLDDLTTEQLRALLEEILRLLAAMSGTGG